MLTSDPAVSILFQSTHSLRSATGLNNLKLYRVIVSIHALLAECDNKQLAG